MADFNMWSPSQIYNENLENRMRDIRDMLTQNQRILDDIRSSGLLSIPDTMHPHNLRHEDLDRASLYPPFLRTPLAEGGRIVTPGYHTCSYARGGVHGKEPSIEHPANTNDYDII